MEYFWTTFGSLLEYPSEFRFDDCSLVFSMECFWGTFGVLLDHFWSTPSKSRFDDCGLVFLPQSASCELCTNNKELHAKPSLPIMKLMQRERYFGGWKYFSYLPSLLKVNWMPLFMPFLLCAIAYQQTDMTCPQHSPARTKRDNALRMKMRLNQDFRGYASQKVRQLLHHGHTIGVCQSLSRAYFNFLPLSVVARWIRKGR